jgi:sulfur carrier protein
MVVEVRLFATLRDGRFKCEKIEVAARCPLRQLLNQLGLSEHEAAIRLVNGVNRPLDCELADEDVVSLFPAIAGG